MLLARAWHQDRLSDNEKFKRVLFCFFAMKHYFPFYIDRRRQQPAWHVQPWRHLRRPFGRHRHRPHRRCLRVPLAQEDGRSRGREGMYCITWYSMAWYRNLLQYHVIHNINILAYNGHLLSIYFRSPFCLRCGVSWSTPPTPWGRTQGRRWSSPGVSREHQSKI